MAASVLEQISSDTELVPVGPWQPTRYTPTLSGTEDFTTEGDKLLRFLAVYWSTPETRTFRLDPWQAWLIRHLLETYPPDWPVEQLRGQLRYRQLVISMARQNGKSVIAACLAIYLLALHVEGPRVVGLASIDRQARIVYDRVRWAIDNNAQLSRELRATVTRGIWRRDGSGLYQTLPAVEDSAQGEPISGAIYDELHLGLAELWDAIVLGQRARRNSLMAGFTTAGDDDSELLAGLYEDGQAAIEGQDQRFGFFCWEAADDELTVDNVIAANPAVACGRVPLDTTMADAEKGWRKGGKHRKRVIRYTLNRFIEGSDTSWAPIGPWLSCRSDSAEDAAIIVPGQDLTYGLEVTESWEYASITANRVVDGIAYTELVAQLVAPSYARLRDVALELGKLGPAAFAVDGVTLKALGRELRENGHEVWIIGADETPAAASSVHATIARRRVRHPGDQLITAQYPKAKRRTSGDVWRISRSLSTGDVDGIIATVLGLRVAELRAKSRHQLF